MSNENTFKELKRIMEIFMASEGAIRPHLTLTGPSGSGKSHSIQYLCNSLGLNVLEVNAAQLTKEGTAGSSLSKALSPLLQTEGLSVVFVDEFDKLFIAGNNNSTLAHEVSHGVQNEFLKALEGITTVYTDYGKYVNIRTDKCLFIFAGAFNGEENIDLDRLREFGVKTEFLGRVGLVYSMEKLSLEDLRKILNNSELLNNYLTLFPEANKAKVTTDIMKVVKDNHENNTLGARLLNTLTHQYFIMGGIKPKQTKKVVFQKTLSLH